VSKIELGRIFLGIGATAFGGLGPALAVIERELVEKRRVLAPDDIAEASAATRFLPGSTLIQVAAFLGYRLGGWGGSALATAACVLPAASAMLALAVAYDRVAALPVFGPAAQGLAAAVVGLLLAAAWRVGRATVTDPVTLGIALAAFGASIGPGIPAAMVIVAAGCVGVTLLAAPGTEHLPGSWKGQGR
jgi:chromate transporter